MIGIIDTPSPFATLQEWRDFLAEMKRLDQNDKDVKAAIREAEKAITSRSPA